MVEGNLNIEGAKLCLKNFSGKEGDYNPPGRRNFGVYLDPDHAEKLKADGWNIRYRRPRDEDEGPRPFLPVGVRFDKYPPRIIQITKSGKTTLDERSVNSLDWAEIINADLVIRPYNWERNGQSGTKAYLKAAYITIEENEFEHKYADINERE